MTIDEVIEKRNKCISDIEKLKTIQAVSEWEMSRAEEDRQIVEWLKDYKQLLSERTGHWIRWYERKDFGLYIENIPHCKCSECGKEYDSHSSQFIKYCNECGAKMVEPQESEDSE